MRYAKTHGKVIAAAKSGMDLKTARKYLNDPEKSGKAKSPRHWRTRKDPFADEWPIIKSMLSNAPGLQAKTIMEWLIANYPGKYSSSNLRSLQNRCREWRACYGPDKMIIFPQNIKPGEQSQSDFTCMNNCNITINHIPFKHLLFHFILPYSRWETVSIFETESFDSLSTGFEKSVWELGAVAPEHRTDNLSAATKKFGNSREFTERWELLLQHYNVKPSRNNPGESHENGSVEKSHDLFKNTVDQQLMLRGSKNFNNIDDYYNFLKWICDLRNYRREAKLANEYQFLQKLPDKKWDSPEIIPVRVSPSSTVSIFKCVYSVPSRLISLQLKAYVYPEKIELYYGVKLVLKFPRNHNSKEPKINYRHIIKHLLRKPGAFKNYQYKECLFPRVEFRKAYDLLVTACSNSASKKYLEILNLAAINNESDVSLFNREATSLTSGLVKALPLDSVHGR